MRHPDVIYARESMHMSGVLVWMLSRCMIKWWKLRDSLAYFSQRWQGIRQGLRTRALICSCMLWANGKGGFFRVENKTSISCWEWIIRSARASCKLQLAHLHSAARVLSSPSRCFQLSTNLDKDFFRYLLCWDAATNFTNAKKATNIMCVSST